MAATRLRKTFHYPDSSDDEDTVEAGMDLQDRETLLTNLQSHDTTSTRLYTHLLLILPTSIALLTLPGLLRTSMVVPSLLALVSLAASAYALYYLPLPPLNTLSDRQAPGGGRAPSSRTNEQAERREVPWLSDQSQALLARYLIPANGVMCGVLALLELLRGREWREGMMVGGGYLPGLVLSVVLWARRELRGVDMSGLQEGLRG
ncbi:hypothetical protein G6514_007858 [Epicoccum nigrum]|nr:hypothetical protein G6514_007858 [Epicoccum nigrum]